MKTIVITLMVILGLSACATHSYKSDDGYYDRANKASEKAHKEFH